MMNDLQYYLTKLAEEASEVAQIALKSQQFGLLEKHPDLPFDNATRIHQELDDLQAMIEELNARGLNYRPDRAAIEAKKLKVEHYKQYSIDLDLVDGNKSN